MSYEHDMLNERIFREHDMRGIAGTDLTRDVAVPIGMAFGSLVKRANPRAASVSVGRDVRKSLQELSSGVVEGILPTRIAVLVVSCDNYADLWQPFFDLFRRFWPDCPFPVYLLTNRKRFDAPGVVTIQAGKDVSWSDNVLEGLRHIKEDFVLMWIDDLFLLEKVDTEALLRVCNEFIKVDGNYIRLNPTVKADKPFNDYFGLASKGTIYRTATVMSLWRKEVLRELLKPGESAWDFEIHGTIRSDVYDGFYSTNETQISVVNTVIKGKWQRSALRMLDELGINITSDRKVMTVRESIKLKLLVARSFMLNIIPARSRRSLKNAILRGKYKYKLE